MAAVRADALACILVVLRLHFIADYALVELLIVVSFVRANTGACFQVKLRFYCAAGLTGSVVEDWKSLVNLIAGEALRACPNFLVFAGFVAGVVDRVVVRLFSRACFASLIF